MAVRKKPKKYGVKTITREDFGLVADMPVFNYADLEVVARLALGTAEGFAGMRQVVTNFQDAYAYQLIKNSQESPQRLSDDLSSTDARLELFFLSLMDESLKVEGLDSDLQYYVWCRLPYWRGRNTPARTEDQDASILEYLSKQRIDLPPYDFNQGTPIGLGEAEREFRFHRLYGLVGILYDLGIVTQHLDEAKTRNKDDPHYDESWFANGYPDFEITDSSTLLSDIIMSLAEDSRINMGDYEIAFWTMTPLFFPDE